MAHALAARGVAHAVHLMQRMRHVISEGALVENPLRVGGRKTAEREEKKRNEEFDFIHWRRCGINFELICNRPGLPNMCQKFSFAPSGLHHFPPLPTARAVGCMRRSAAQICVVALSEISEHARSIRQTGHSPIGIGSSEQPRARIKTSPTPTAAPPHTPRP